MLSHIHVNIQSQAQQYLKIFALEMNDNKNCMMESTWTSKQEKLELEKNP